MENKFTPGKWSVDTESMAVRADREKNNCVCYMPFMQFPNKELSEEMHANLKLLSAAPELLKALQACYKWAEKGADEDLTVFQQALAAIKTATE